MSRKERQHSQSQQVVAKQEWPEIFVVDIIGCISLNPLFLSQKNTFFFPRKQKQIYSKYLPSQVT